MGPLSPLPLLPSPPDFPHTFHSPTLQAVDRYFPPTTTTTQTIRIPVVNPDLLSPLPLSPPDYDIRVYTDLERVVHAAHMEEIWYQAGKVYTDIQEGGGITEPGLCECVRDVESNGVIRMLRVIAGKVRQDEVSTPGMNDDKENVDLVSNLFFYDFDNTDDEKVPHLQSREDWEAWKLNMKMMEPLLEEHNKYLAIYMYCMLN